MSFIKIFSLAFLGISFGASASTIAPLNKDDRNCERSIFCRPYNDLFHQVNIIAQNNQNGVPIKEDPRWSWIELGSRLGFSPTVIAEVSAVSGMIYCPGKKFRNAAVVSAWLYNGVWITPVHAFIDDLGQRREPLEECYAEIQFPRRTRVQLDFNSPSTKFYTENWKDFRNSRYDLALVRPKNAMESSGIPLKLSTRPVQRGDKLIMISATQERLTRKIGTNAPIAQVCTVQHVGLQIEQNHQVFYSDCTSTPGASGSIQFVKRSDGVLEVVGIVTSSGGSELDYQPYNFAKRSFTYSIAINDPLREDIERQTQLHPTQTRMRREPK